MIKSHYQRPEYKDEVANSFSRVEKLRLAKS